MFMRPGFFVLAAILFCSPAFASSEESPDGHHDSESPAAYWVLTNGKFFTVDDQQPWGQALVLSGDRIVYVGDEAGAAEYVSDAARITNLGGRLVIPGLVDSHTHPGLMGVEQYGAVDETDEEDILRVVKTYADSHPEKKWIRMCCWSESMYGKDGPHRRELDAIVPDRPVWFTSSSTHSAWLNSKALEELGIDRDTPDPAPGVSLYVRDESGEPTGYLKELYGLYGEGHFDIDSEVHEQGMTDFVNFLSEHGVTTLYDAGTDTWIDRIYSFMNKLQEQGRLPVRYEGTFNVFFPAHVDPAVPEMRRLERSYGGDRLRFNTVKFYMDGVTANHTAAVLQPYEDYPGNRGGTTLSVAELRDFLLELDDAEFDIHIHVIGDRGVRDVLDAVEAAQQAVVGEFYPRVTISHLKLIDPADFVRIKRLGVIANYTPWWHGIDPLDDGGPLGAERNDRSYPVKPLFDLGVPVTFSSDDWSLPYLSPFLGMEVSHNRQFPKDWIPFPVRAWAWLTGSDTLGPDSEQLDLELVIRAYTLNGAYQLRMENEIGSLEAGKLADLVVLDDNLFEMDRSEIHKVKPSAVIMEGKLIHGSLP